MANFLIQTIKGQIRHDFSFALIEAIEFQNWRNKGTHDYVFADLEDEFDKSYDEYIPSGTIQFVQKYLAAYHDLHRIYPINIPNDLNNFEYLKRKVEFPYLTKGNNIFETDKFVKSDITIKGFTDITNSIELQEIERFLISDLIDIQSEWRSFVFNGELVGLQNYLGDFTMMPDVALIQKMIYEYKKCPPSYSLDVGVNEKDGTFLIEVHNFFSVGTYGFADNRYLPQMFIQSYKHLVRNGF